MHSNSSAHNDALLLILLLLALNWYPLLQGHMPKSTTSNQFIPLMMCTLFWKSYTKDKLENNTNIPISTIYMASIKLFKKLYIIPHLHNSFLFQCDVTRSFHRYEGPQQTVYWPRAYNFVSTVLVYWQIQV